MWEWVQVELARHAVHLLLARPHNLWDAEAAKAVARLAVRVDEIRIDPGTWQPVRAKRAVPRVPGYDRPDVCARLAREALEAGRSPANLDAAVVSAAVTARAGRPITLSAASVRAALDPWLSAASRRSAGGTARPAVREALAEAERILAADRAALAARLQADDRARRDLEARGEALAASAGVET